MTVATKPKMAVWRLKLDSVTQPFLKWNYTRNYVDKEQDVPRELGKSFRCPTNRSQAPHVQASARTQRMTQDKQWDGGPCRSHRPVPAHVSRDREGTCGHAIRRSWYLQNPSGSPPAFPWSQDPGDWSVRRAPGSSADCRACARLPAATFLRRRVRGSSYLHLRRRTGMLPPSAMSRDRPGENLVATVR